MPVRSDSGSRLVIAAPVPHAMPGGSIAGAGLAPPPCLRDSGFGIGGRSVMGPGKAAAGVRSVVVAPVAGVRVSTVGIPCIPAHARAHVPGWTCVGRAPSITADLAVLNALGVVPVAALVPRVVHYGAILPPAIGSHVGIELVRLPRAAGNVAPQGLGFLAALFCFLAQPRSVNLCLLGVGSRPDGLGLPLAGINFHILGFTPDLGGLLPVLLVPLLLHGFPAPSSGQEQQHDQYHHNNGNYHPYPWSCIHVSHHFPLRCDRAGPRHSG
jgi:hypothetical protein